MVPADVSRHPPSVSVARDGSRLRGKCRVHKPARAGKLLRKILFEQVAIRLTIRECKQAHTRVRRDLCNERHCGFNLRIRIGKRVNAAKRTFHLVALRDVAERIMAMIPTVIRNVHESRIHSRPPPLIAPPAAAENASLIQHIAGISGGNDKRRRVHGRLHAGIRGHKITHDIEHASLQTSDWMRQILVVKICAIVKRNRHAPIGPGPIRSGEKLHKGRHGNDSPPKCREQAQVFSKRDVVIAEVVVAVDIQRVVSKDGDGHTPILVLHTTLTLRGPVNSNHQGCNQVSKTIKPRQRDRILKEAASLCVQQSCCRCG